MRVAVVTHNIVKGDGQGRVNYELVHYLLNQGVEVDLIADQVADSLLSEGAAWHPVHPGFDRLILLKVWRFKHMANHVLSRLKNRYDAILACGVVLDRPHAINVVHFVHHAWLQSGSHPLRNEIGVNSLYQGIFSWLNARWEARVLRKADVVVGVSEQIRDELIEKVGLPSRSVRAIVNGVDIEEFRPGTASRKALGLPEEETLAFFAGDIQSSRKNLGTVLRALVDVPKLHLVIAGDETESRYPALAEELGLSERTHFLGFRRDVPDLMRATDFFVFPSRYEACTLVLLEAMASGLPVITARTAGGAELVKGDAGFVLDDPEDESRLAQHMRVLSEKVGRRAAMSEAARAVAEQHRWEDMAAQYHDLLEEISQQPSAFKNVTAV